MSESINAVSRAAWKSDKDFVFWAYRNLLYRDPEPRDIFHHLTLLHAGRSMSSILEGIKASAEYAAKHSERDVEVPWVLARLSESDKRVLDVGCAESTYLTNLVGKRELYGLDPREPLVDIPPGMAYFRDDICQPPPELRPSSFDAIICISTIEHIGLSAYDQPTFEDGDRLALRAMMSLLKPRGKLLLTAPYGKRENHGWFRVYSDDDWMKLLGDIRPITQDFYICKGSFYAACLPRDLSDVEYLWAPPYQRRTGRAGGVICCQIANPKET